MSQEFMFGALLFGTVAILAFALSGLVFQKDPVARRLRNEGDDVPPRMGGMSGGGGAVATEAVVPVMERIGHAAARPFMPKTAAKQSTLRKQLMYAGIYT